MKKLFIISSLFILSCKKDTIEPDISAQCTNTTDTLELCPWHNYWDWFNYTVASDSTDGSFRYNPYSPEHSFTAINAENGAVDNFFIDATNGNKIPLNEFQMNDLNF